MDFRYQGQSMGGRQARHVNCSNLPTQLPPSSSTISSAHIDSSEKDILCWMKASKKTNSLSNPAAVKLQKDGYDLPSHDALAQLLPNHRHVLESEGAAERPSSNKRTMYLPHKRPPLQDCEDEPRMAEITSHQTKEVENYRAAMTKMAEDIIALRTQVMTLEGENSQLRSDLSLHRDLGRDLLDDADVDVMTKAEISDRINSLKVKLASETSKAASQRDRIQQLQNDLIKKNDSEKKLLRLQRVHQQLQQDLQHQKVHLTKMATLEATVKQQDMIIKETEKASDSRSGDKRQAVKKQRGESENRKGAAESTLLAENRRLREELDRIGQQPAPVSTQPSSQTKETLPLKEKLSLVHDLEKAEARVKALEAQLEENAKLWGRQKQEMLSKLSERRHGFVRTSTMILHSAPLSR